MQRGSSRLNASIFCRSSSRAWRCPPNWFSSNSGRLTFKLVIVDAQLRAWGWQPKERSDGNPMLVSHTAHQQYYSWHIKVSPAAPCKSMTEKLSICLKCGSWATKRRVHQQNQSSGEMMTMMRPWLQLLANARFRHIELRFCKLEFFTDAITNNIDSATSITNTSTLNKKLRSIYALVFWETSQWQAKRKKDSIVFNQRDPCASTARKCKYVEQHATISWYIVCTSWIIASSDEKNLCAAERGPVLTDWSAKPYNTVSFFWRSPKDRSKTDRCGRDWKMQLTKSCTEDDYISLTSNRFARSTIVTTNVFPSHRRTHIVSKHLRPPVSTRSEFHESFWLQ